MQTIAELVNDRKIEGIAEVRDESEREDSPPRHRAQDRTRGRRW